MSVKGRIVVIDDEVNAAAALETLLKEDGYDVARAHDARGGLLLLEKHDPDVVLTDLRMPGMDGIELLAKIKEMRPETMVIVMTAYGTVKTAVKAMKLGAEDYLSKPIDVEELEVVLQKALDKKGLLAEISNSISSNEANITNARVDTTDEKKAVLTFEMEIQDLGHLRKVIRDLEKIKGVTRVERMRV